jgi:hypothetical protein
VAEWTARSRRSAGTPPASAGNAAIVSPPSVSNRHPQTMRIFPMKIDSPAAEIRPLKNGFHFFPEKHILFRIKLKIKTIVVHSGKIFRQNS